MTGAIKFLFRDWKLAKVREAAFMSVIILSYNSEKFIERCLTSVLKSSYPRVELILVDNGSSDRSVDTIRGILGSRDNCKIIEVGRNSGFASGNNLGASFAKGEYLVFLNIDTEVDPHWLDALASIFEPNWAVGAIQAKLMSMDDRKVFDSAGDCVDYYGASFSLGGDWREVDYGQYDSVREIFSARGAALAIRKRLFEQIGRFDDSFFLDFEDIDLGWRVRLAGYKIMFAPESVVYHVGSSRRFSERASTRSYHPIKNRYATMIKNYEKKNLVKFLVPDFFLFFLPTIIVDIEKRRFAFIVLRTRAILWILLNLPNIMKKRVEVQSRIRTLSDAQIMKSMIKTDLSKRVRFGAMVRHFGAERAIRWYTRSVADYSSRQRSS